MDIQTMTDAQRINKAIEIAVELGGFDGAHHKDYVIDQMVRVLAGSTYDVVVENACASGAEWDVGIAP